MPLRPIAPKVPSHPVLPVQHSLAFNYNIRDEQHTEGPTVATANVPLQHQAAPQPYMPPIPSSHDSSCLSPNYRVTSLERQQHVVVAPPTNIYSNRVSVTPVDDGYSDLAPENLPSGARVVTSESASLSAEYSPYGNLQLQETSQNQQGQSYWIPTPDTQEVCSPGYQKVWTAMVQPTIGVHQRQCSKLNRALYAHTNIYPSDSTQFNHCNILSINSPIYPCTIHHSIKTGNIWHVSIVPRSGALTLKASCLVTRKTRG